MLARIGAGASGIRDYLEKGRKKGREYDRDLIDERLPLMGDIELMDSVIDSIQTKQEGDSRYLHISLSFAEDFSHTDEPKDGQISLERIKKTVEQYRSDLMAGYEQEEYVFYAEAHIPKVSHELHTETGESIKRLPHVHIVIPTKNIASGAYLNPLGYGSFNLEYHDAIQEKINHDLGLKSPDDSPRDRPYINPLAKHTERPQPTTAKELRQRVKAIVDEGGVANLDQLAEKIKKHGEIKLRKGKNGDYLNIKIKGHKRGINLKEYTADTLKNNEIILAKKQERITGVATKTPEQYKELVEHWKTQRAFEVRFVSSKTRRITYKEMDTIEKLEWLEQRKNKVKNGVLEKINRGLEDDNQRTANRETGRDQRDISRGDRPEHADRTFTSDHDRGAANATQRDTGFSKASTAGAKNNSRKFIGDIKDASDADKRIRNLRQDQAISLAAVAQSKAVIASLTKDGKPIEPITLSARRIKSALVTDKQRFSHNTRNIEKQKTVSSSLELDKEGAITDYRLKSETSPFLVLEAARKAFGINPELYSVGAGKDGTPRIFHDKKQYNLGDFFTKHLEIPWSEAKEILTECYKETLSDGLPPPDKALWTAFNGWRSQAFEQRKQNKEALQKSLRVRILEAKEQYQAQKKEAYQSRGDKRHQLLAQARANRVDTLAQITKQRKEGYENLKPMNRNAEYRMFLMSLAEKGDVSAIGELRRIAKVMPDMNKDFANGDQDKVVIALPHYIVDAKGNVIYKDNNKAVLRDSRKGVEVLETSDATYDLAIKVAVSRYGMTLNLNGDRVFKEKMIAAAERSGMALLIKDSDNRFREPIKVNHKEKDR